MRGRIFGDDEYSIRVSHLRVSVMAEDPDRWTLGLASSFKRKLPSAQKVSDMTSIPLHKGNYITVGVSLTDYDGAPDLTTPVSVSASNQLFVEPVASGNGNRDFYVSVSPSATVSSAGVVSLVATIQATGSGVGAPPATKSVSYQIDVIIPVDHRDATPTTPSAENLLPHP